MGACASCAQASTDDVPPPAEADPAAAEAALNTKGPPPSVLSYPIGTPGQPWGEAERKSWYQRASSTQRSYEEDVVSRVMALEDRFEVVLYGRLYDRYSLFAVRSKQWDASKPCCLVSGGVHGYETSGVKVCPTRVCRPLLPVTGCHRHPRVGCCRAHSSFWRLEPSTTPTRSTCTRCRASVRGDTRTSSG